VHAYHGACFNHSHEKDQTLSVRWLELWWLCRTESQGLGVLKIRGLGLAKSDPTAQFRNGPPSYIIKHKVKIMVNRKNLVQLFSLSGGHFTQCIFFLPLVFGRRFGKWNTLLFFLFSKSFSRIGPTLGSASHESFYQ
jgi:hypothetical protein